MAMRGMLKSFYNPPKPVGYFMNTLAKLNNYIERENKRGADIPRFTKTQIRKIALFLEDHELFNFDALRKKPRPAPKVKADPVAIYTRYAKINGTLEVPAKPVGKFEHKRKPTWEAQKKAFKKIVKEHNNRLPVSVLDELL
jgi:hypothetical protein